MLMMLMMLALLVALKQRGLSADAHDADDAGVLVVVKQGGLAANADYPCLLVAVKQGRRLC